MRTQLPKKDKWAQHAPLFGLRLLRPNGGWIKMPLGTEAGVGPGQVVLYRDLSGGAGFPSNTMLPGPTPTFVPSLSVTLMNCGQMAGWIKIKLGVEVGLGPGHIVLDGDQLPSPMEHVPSPMSVVAKRLD